MHHHTIWGLVGFSLLACCLIMVFVWVWAHTIKNAGVVDIFWSYNFPVIAIILYFLAGGDHVRKSLICGIVVIHGLRLGTHLLTRVTSNLDKEDSRYAHIRAEWGAIAETKFFWFFQMQAFSNVFLAIPFFIIATNMGPQLSVLECIGAAIWAIAFLGESIADWQLKKFVTNPANKGKVCNVGLWNYSRHPNYFFEWMMWVAYFVMAVASPYGWLAVISPLSILFLLLKVTGVPLAEQQSLKSKPEAYKVYQQTTSAFVPWFGKR